VISVHKEEGIAEVLKEREIVHRQEETGGERTRDLGFRATKDLPREKSSLHEVTKGGVNPCHWIWKGHREEIHTIHRSITQKIRGYYRGETPEGHSLNRSQS
jgi:hypothetical protein